MNASVSELWERFKVQHPDAPNKPVAIFHFCDNRVDAEECLRLVLAGQKKATAASLPEYELCGDPLPNPGDLNVVTDFDGTAHAVIRTTDVEVKRFADVDAQFAREEGEGDLTLEWWRRAHHAYFTRALSGTKFAVDDDLLITCERFELVFIA
jgi:uncharacterized protein YhfF